jgi:hypothetical protein
MKILSFVPGAIASPAAITIPAEASDIDAVVSAQIVRLPASGAIPDHAQVAVVAALADHAVHSHPLSFSAGGAGATIITGAALLSASSGAQVVGAGGAAGDGVRNNAAAQAHAAGAAAVAHGASVGADPVVAAVPTRLTTRTFSLNVNTVLGDLLTLRYREVGERVLVS